MVHRHVNVIRHYVRTCMCSSIGHRIHGVASRFFDLGFVSQGDARMEERKSEQTTQSIGHTSSEWRPELPLWRYLSLWRESVGTYGYHAGPKVKRVKSTPKIMARVGFSSLV